MIARQNNKIEYAESVADSLQKSECVIIMVHWKEFEKLDEAQKINAEQHEKTCHIFFNIHD